MKTILITLLIPVIMFGQIKRIITNAGDVFEIPEIGGLALQERDQLRVDNVISAENRGKAYKNIDIKNGDIILMMNGKKLETARNASDIYENLKPGDEVKLGIKRGEQMFIVSFKKADPKDLPKLKRMIIKHGEGGKDTKKVITKPEKK